MIRARRFSALVGAAVLLVAAGCSDGGAGQVSETVEETEETTETTEAETAPDFPEGTTMAALAERGKLVLGTKFDQRGFGVRNAASGDVAGFDVEIAKLIAAALFGGSPEDAAGKIQFVESVSKNRESFLAEGKVDMVVATYTINDERKKTVDFAGPYFVARQDIMVEADDTDIKSVDVLNGKKVCSVQGSTSLTNLMAKAPEADTSITFDTYSKCAEAMGDGRVEAVTTDSPILAGLVADSAGAFKLVGAPFSDEPYGIGVPKGDDAFRDFVNDVLEEAFASGDWVTAFEATLGEIELPTPEPPAVDRY